LKNFHPDTGIASLRVAFEYKYANNVEKLKTVISGIYEDVQGYHGSDDWKTFIGIIYTTQQFATDEEVKNMVSKLPANWKIITVFAV
jgi:hypothetical protein